MLSVVQNIEEYVGAEKSTLASFDDLWILMVRKEARKDAMKAWAQMPEGERFKAVVAAASWRRVWLMRGDTRYIPLPASWLRGERYEDELPAEFVQAAHASHVAAVVPDKGERSEMPDHVRALIAKLRNK